MGLQLLSKDGGQEAAVHIQEVDCQLIEQMLSNCCDSTRAALHQCTCYQQEGVCEGRRGTAASELSDPKIG